MPAANSILQGRPSRATAARNERAALSILGDYDAPTQGPLHEVPMPQQMNPLQTRARGAERVSARAWLRRLEVVAALSALSIACGSAQSNGHAPGGGSAGVGLAGDASAGHNSAGGAGASAGSAGAIGDSGGGASGGNQAKGGAASGASGTSGSGGKGGAGAAGGNGGSGGATLTPTCPATAPLGASPCVPGGPICYYEDCAGAGRTVASCQKQGMPGFSWSVETAACATVQCFGIPGALSCASGQVCSVTQGGAISGMCVQSTCGSGPITCECAHAACTDCTTYGGTEQGFTVTCNTCPQGGCP